MTKIPELGLDDGLLGARFAHDLKKQMITDGAEPGIHRFERLPSYEGYAGMCACGFETPQPSYEHMGDLTRPIWEHLERDVFPPVDEAALLGEIEIFKLADLVGYHRLIENTEEHGIRHVGWLVAGTRGTARVKADGAGAFQGEWITFGTEQQES
ncbi:hypothetical protein [Streptomyces acidiscabies]|uniref:Uncharacterized protein n=1 Tax=Streptomyces acidiscabies TaxID=42234 RepID=A0ABU4LYC0_9ACTN|nr:hypothetical protein [Streptomyces acidiscabies]MDX3019994.1 hypothetical protein [Streptomyces acidiscabies]